jgi:hypothetical protein
MYPPDFASTHSCHGVTSVASHAFASWTALIINDVGLVQRRSFFAQSLATTASQVALVGGILGIGCLHVRLINWHLFVVNLLLFGVHLEERVIGLRRLIGYVGCKRNEI